MRYVIDPEDCWRPDPENRHLQHVHVEVTNLIDTRTGRTYHDGAYRVMGVNPPQGARPKVFKGETAWSDAARYASDLDLQARLASA